MSKMRFTHNGAAGRVEVDGKDYSNGVMGVAIEAHGGRPPTVQLTILAWRDADVELDDADVRLADESRDLVLALGWTPPGEKARIEARALQDADIALRNDPPRSGSTVNEWLRERADRILAAHTGQPTAKQEPAEVHVPYANDTDAEARLAALTELVHAAKATALDGAHEHNPACLNNPMCQCGCDDGVPGTRCHECGVSSKESNQR